MRLTPREQDRLTIFVAAVAFVSKRVDPVTSAPAGFVTLSRLYLLG